MKLKIVLQSYTNTFINFSQIHTSIIRRFIFQYSQIHISIVLRFTSQLFSDSYLNILRFTSHLFSDSYLNCSQVHISIVPRFISQYSQIHISISLWLISQLFPDSYLNIPKFISQLFSHSHLHCSQIHISIFSDSCLNCSPDSYLYSFFLRPISGSRNEDDCPRPTSAVPHVGHGQVAPAAAGVQADDLHPGVPHIVGLGDAAGEDEERHLAPQAVAPLAPVPAGGKHAAGRFDVAWMVARRPAQLATFS